MSFDKCGKSMYRVKLRSGEVYLVGRVKGSKTVDVRGLDHMYYDWDLYDIKTSLGIDEHSDFKKPNPPLANSNSELNKEDNIENRLSEIKSSIERFERWQKNPELDIRSEKELSSFNEDKTYIVLFIFFVLLFIAWLSLVMLYL